jgi:flagellar basal body-associated protein FliL
MTDQPALEAGESRFARKRSRRLMGVLIVAGLMIVEGIFLFCLINWISPPPPEAVAGEDSAGISGQGSGPDENGLSWGDGLAEVDLTSCTLTNRNGPKAFTVTISVSVLVREMDEERVREQAERMKSRINDRVNFVVRSADQKYLNQPGLETIKRHLRNELEKCFGDDQLIVEVLVPELIQAE